MHPTARVSQPKHSPSTPAHPKHSPFVFMHKSNSARESKDGINNLSAYRPGSRFTLPLLLPVLLFLPDDDEDDILLLLAIFPYRFLNSCIWCRSNVLACVVDNIGAPPILPAQNASTKNIPAFVNISSSLLMYLLVPVA